jgi:hypothetical protein
MSRTLCNRGHRALKALKALRGPRARREPPVHSAGASGHTSRAVAFSGGVITIPGPTNIPYSPQIWVEAWIQPQAPLNATRTIFTRESSYALKQINQNISFQVQGANGAPLCVATTGGSYISMPGVWHHVAGWYDGLSATVQVDGVVSASISCPNGPILAIPGAPFHVGGLLNGLTVTEEYAGRIDEIRVRQGGDPSSVATRRGSLNVTNRVNSTRTALPTNTASITMESFTVDKKSPTSILLIEGAISGWGTHAGAMTQGWRLGNGVETVAQGLDYDENNHSKLYATRAVISGHTTTGPQVLVFRYFSANGATGNVPFPVYNPNASDDARFAQTRSIYTVWEIEP